MPISTFIITLRANSRILQEVQSYFNDIFIKEFKNNKNEKSYKG